MIMKPICWHNIRDNKDVIFRVKSDLPLGHDILIYKESDEWCWNLFQGTKIIKKGHTQSLEEAKKRCVEVWHERLRKAFVPSSFYILLTDDGIETICSTRAEVEEKVKEVTGSENGKGDFHNVLKYTIDLDGTITLAEEWGK